MSASLVRLTILERTLLQDWLKRFLSYEELLQLFQQDSWDLCEAVCYLFSKPSQPALENAVDAGNFFLKACRLVDELKSSSSEHFHITYELISRLIKAYDKTARAIEGGKLLATKEPVIRRLNSHTKYRVTPRDFLLWAHKNGHGEVEHIKKLLKDHVLTKKPGRPRACHLELFVQISNQPNVYGILNSTQILKLPQAQQVFNCHFGKLSPQKKRSKMKTIEKQLREHPQFGGLRRQKAKKGEK